MRSLTLGTVVLLAALLFPSEKALAEARLDIAMEGPWIFFVQSNFKTAAGPSNVLIAVAPLVSGHYLPVVGAGNGGQITDYGLKCVVFDGVCIPKPTTASALSHDGYADPYPIVLSQAGWNWSKVSSSAFVIILPMPDYISADGKESLTFQKVIPTSAMPNSPSTSAANFAIGLQLHYEHGPNIVGLYRCTSTSDASSCTQNVFPGNEDNSGTLRIAIRSDETPSDLDNCKYHLHGAYHAMLGLVDRNAANNPDKAYLDMPAYDKNCTPGDPQQIPFPLADSSIDMGHSTSEGEMSSTTNVATSLDTLVVYLRSLKLQHGVEESLSLPQLSDQADQLRGKVPRLSNLSELSAYLKNSQEVISNLLMQLKAQSHETARRMTSHRQDADLPIRLNVVLLRERALQAEAQFAALSIISGKDCRAAMVLVQ
jgi:hypothetical protein